MTKYDDEVLLLLTRITRSHSDCLNDYEKIVSECNTKLMSRGIDLYGMFFPDEELKKYYIYKGKLTKNEKKRHYTYFFDDKNRLRLTERYDDDGTLLNLIFFYHKKDFIEIVWYKLKDKRISIVGFVDYEDGKIARFVESDIMLEKIDEGEMIKSYREDVFNKDDEYVLHRVFSLHFFMGEKPWETLSKMKKK